MKLRLGLGAVLLCLPLLSYADGCSLSSGGYHAGNSFAGSTACVKANMTSLSVNGPVTIQQSTITSAVINGPTDLNRSTVFQLTANGPLKLTEANINELVLQGSLDAKKSTINKIKISGEITLTDSTVTSVTFKRKSLASSPSKIYLKGKSQVNGDIVFENGQGLVYAEKTAKVTGKIIGGKLEAMG